MQGRVYISYDNVSFEFISSEMIPTFSAQLSRLLFYIMNFEHYKLQFNFKIDAIQYFESLTNEYDVNANSLVYKCHCKHAYNDIFTQWVPYTKFQIS